MKLLPVFLLIVFFLFGFATAQAEESTTVNSSEAKLDTTGQTNPETDIDKEITNARMRAMSGKKSGFSMYSDLTYSGGSVYKPFGPERPLLTPGQLLETKTKLSGTIAFRIRFSPKDSINIGGGVGLTTPGHSGQSGQIENPSLSYSHVFRGAAETQNIFTAGLTQYTAKEMRQMDAMNSLYIGHTLVKSYGSTSRVSLGFTTFLNYALYSADAFLSDDSPRTYDYSGSRRARTDLTAAFFPFMEYALSDTYSLRTSYTGLMYYHYRGDGSPLATAFYSVDPTHSLGLGISVTRDIYILPNIQWVWTDMRADKTTLAISTNFSL